jgi:hypothetical protein
MITFYRSPCSKCEAMILLARITPGPRALTSEYSNALLCDHVHQRVVALVDPMKSKETTGCFRDELRAPT